MFTTPVAVPERVTLNLFTQCGSGGAIVASRSAQTSVEKGKGEHTWTLVALLRFSGGQESGGFWVLGVLFLAEISHRCARAEVDSLKVSGR